MRRINPAINTAATGSLRGMVSAVPAPSMGRLWAAWAMHARIAANVQGSASFVNFNSDNRTYGQNNPPGSVFLSSRVAPHLHNRQTPFASFGDHSFGDHRWVSHSVRPFPYLNDSPSNTKV